MPVSQLAQETHQVPAECPDCCPFYFVIKLAGLAQPINTLYQNLSEH
jgi:hypothetical protein